MKRLLYRFLVRPLLVILGSIGIYLLAAYGLSNITIKEMVVDNPDIDIYLLSNGVHTDIVFPVKHPLKDWSQSIPFEHTAANDSSLKFIAIGWGDKGFYLETPTWAELQPSVAFKAAFGLNETAMHTVYHHHISTNEQCKKIRINANQYQQLIQYVENSFEKPQGQYKRIDFAYGKNDCFYEAEGRYSMFTTCNTWTNNGLKAAGLRHCYWTPFQQSIIDLYP